MIEKIARRAGGFASTTAMRWFAAARDGDVRPAQDSHATHGKPVVAGAVALAAAALSTKTARRAAESALRGLAGTLRTDDGSGSNGNGSNGNGSNGNGAIGDLTRKTRAELYELAKKADVAGRSAMSKEELTRALSG